MNGAVGADGTYGTGATSGGHLQIHGSAVAVAGRGCLITGASGAGKSALAIEMIALGAELVADDRVDLRRAGDDLVMSAPPAIAGLIEARGVGILRLGGQAGAPLALIVDLDRAETERLPEARRRDVLGVPCRLLPGRARAGLAALVVVLLRAGLSIRPPDGPAHGSD